MAPNTRTTTEVFTATSPPGPTTTRTRGGMCTRSRSGISSSRRKRVGSEDGQTKTLPTPTPRRHHHHLRKRNHRPPATAPSSPRQVAKRKKTMTKIVTVSSTNSENGHEGDDDGEGEDVRLAAQDGLVVINRKELGVAGGERRQRLNGGAEEKENANDGDGEGNCHQGGHTQMLQQREVADQLNDDDDEEETMEEDEALELAEERMMVIEEGIHDVLSQHEANGPSAALPLGGEDAEEGMTSTQTHGGVVAEGAAPYQDHQNGEITAAEAAPGSSGGDVCASDNADTPSHTCTGGDAPTVGSMLMEPQTVGVQWNLLKERARSLSIDIDRFDVEDVVSLMQDDPQLDLSSMADSDLPPLVQRIRSRSASLAEPGSVEQQYQTGKAMATPASPVTPVPTTGGVVGVASSKSPTVTTAVGVAVDGAANALSATTTALVSGQQRDRGYSFEFFSFGDDAGLPQLPPPPAVEDEEAANKTWRRAAEKLAAVPEGDHLPPEDEAASSTAGAESKEPGGGGVSNPSAAMTAVASVTTTSAAMTPLRKNGTNATAMQQQRPRGDSIIFDPSSFGDGGIHEQTALLAVGRGTGKGSPPSSPSVATEGRPSCGSILEAGVNVGDTQSGVPPKMDDAVIVNSSPMDAAGASSTGVAAGSGLPNRSPSSPCANVVIMSLDVPGESPGSTRIQPPAASLDEALSPSSPRSTTARPPLMLPPKKKFLQQRTGFACGTPVAASNKIVDNVLPVAAATPTVPPTLSAPSNGVSHLVAASTPSSSIVSTATPSSSVASKVVVPLPSMAPPQQTSMVTAARTVTAISHPLSSPSGAPSLSPTNGGSSGVPTVLHAGGIATYSLELLNKGGRIGIYLPEERKLRIAKFHSKRKSRIWRKRIKYDCRKKLADSRPRIKGRFVRRCDVEDGNQD